MDVNLIIMRGLPASGKTTWAKEYVANNPGTVRVNRDDLREMFFCGDRTQWTKNFEEVVRNTRDEAIIQALSSGYSVVVDEICLFNRVVQRLWEIAEHVQDKYGVVVSIKFQSFLQVPVEECIKRDAQRSSPIGEEVIQRLFRKYLKEVNKEFDEPDEADDK